MIDQSRRLMNTLVNGADRAQRRTRVESYPLAIHIEVNDFCNLHCPYCPRENPAIPKNTANIPVEAIRRLAPWMRFANYVGLAGNGEPFIHPQIMEILRLVKSTGVTPSITTNGTRLRPAVIEELPGLGAMILTISVDGGKKETFERWRRGANFDQVRDSLLALRRSRERRNTPFPVVNFQVCLMKENLEETEEIVNLAAEAGAAVVAFQTMFPYVKSLEHLRVTDLKALNAAVDRARRRAAPLGIRIDYVPMSLDLEYREGTAEENRVGTMEKLESLHVQGKRSEDDDGALRIVSRPPKGQAATPFTCRNLWTTLHVTIRGDVRFCCFWTGQVVGNILTDPLESLWNSARWEEVRGALASGCKPECCQGCHVLERHAPQDIWRETHSHLANLMSLSKD